MPINNKETVMRVNKFLYVLVLAFLFNCSSKTEKKGDAQSAKEKSNIETKEVQTVVAEERAGTEDRAADAQAVTDAQAAVEKAKTDVQAAKSSAEADKIVLISLYYITNGDS